MRVKNIDYPISQVASNAQQALQEFQQADCVVSTSVAAHSQPWNSGLPPPPQNSLKVNFDRAIFKNINKVGIGVVRSCALPIHPTTNWWRMRGHTFFIAFDRRPSPLVLERIVKSLTMRLQRLEPMTRLWYHLSDRVLYRSIQWPIGERWGSTHLL